jgi:ABC-2 type transport system permease protein
VNVRPDWFSQSPPALFALLLRVHRIQFGRRLLAVREQSKLLTAFVALFLGGYLVLAFWLFHSGLSFIGSFPGLGVVLTERLVYLLFAFLFGLLLLSNLVIAFGTFFRNRETVFLLTLPVSREALFRWKWLESVVLASWAFLFLIAPFLLAFGLSRQVAWHFYVLTPFLIALFIVLPGVAGAWFALLLARHLDRRAFQVGLLTAGLLLLAWLAFWWKAQPLSDELADTRTVEMLDQLLVKTNFALFPFQPGYWLTQFLVQWAERSFAAAGFFLLVLLSHALFFGALALTRLGRLFYDTASAVQSRPSVWHEWRRPNPASRPSSTMPSASLLERALALLPGLRLDDRALLVKDVRMFWRDTTQWGQSVMLFGLLAIYIMNLRHFTQQLNSAFWVNLVSFMNLGACALNLATVTTRFVYPQFSLEGRRMWIVGLAPMGLERVVLVKFWLATSVALMVTLGLNVLSCVLLELNWDRTLLFAGVVTLMAFTLNGLAVGLGVLFPNFREPNPSKIVSGFGGTLCLVLSFLYILASVLLLAATTAGVNWLTPSISRFLLCVTGFVVLSALLGWLPLRAALRQTRRFEL